MWSTSGVLQQPRRLIATLLQSLALLFGRIPVEDQSTVHPKDRSCFSRRRRCSRKQDSHSTGAIRRFSQDGMHKKDTEIHWQCTMLAKKKSCFSIASLFKDDFSATRAERLQNAKHWVLRLNADGHQKPLRQRPEFAYALKQCFEMQDAHLAQSEGGENFDYYVDRKTGWRYYRERESHGETRRQRLHLQLRSGQLHNGKRVGTHGSLHHLRNGGDFGFLERIPENRRRGVDRTPTHNTDLCCAVCSQARTASHALGSRASTAQVTRIAVSSLRAWNESVIWCCTCLDPWLLHLPFTTSTSSSSFTLPCTTQEHAAQSVQQEQLREHSPSRQVAPSRITLAWRPAEWRKPAQDNSHRLWAQRACDCLKDRRLLWRSISIIWCTGKFRRRRSPSPRSPKKWRNLERKRQLAFRILKYQRRPTSNRRCISTIPCRFWSRRWRVTEDVDFTTVRPESLGKTRCNGRAGERGKCTIHSSRSKGKFEASFIWRSESFSETQCILFVWTEKLDQEFCVQKR